MNVQSSAEASSSGLNTSGVSEPEPDPWQAKNKDPWEQSTTPPVIDPTPTVVAAYPWSWDTKVFEYNAHMKGNTFWYATSDYNWCKWVFDMPEDMCTSKEMQEFKKYLYDRNWPIVRYTHNRSKEDNEKARKQPISHNTNTWKQDKWKGPRSR